MTCRCDGWVLVEDEESGLVALVPPDVEAILRGFLSEPLVRDDGVDDYEYDSLEELYSKVPVIEVEDAFQKLFSHLDTGDAWGWELESYIRNKMEHRPPKRGKDPEDVMVAFERFQAKPYREQVALLTSWVGKDEIRRSLKRW
jgi:hypothetical protein